MPARHLYTHLLSIGPDNLGKRGTAEVQLFRHGVWVHWLGGFTVDDDFYKAMEANYKTYPVEEQSLDFGHGYHPDDHAGWFRALYRDNGGTELWGSVYNLTPKAVDSIANDDVRYISPAFYGDYESPEEPGKSRGPTFMGAALTNRPFLTNMKGIVMNSTGGFDVQPPDDKAPFTLYMGSIMDPGAYARRFLDAGSPSPAAREEGRGGDLMDLTKLTAEELAQARPDLLLSVKIPDSHPQLVEATKAAAEAAAAKKSADDAAAAKEKELSDEKARREKVEADLVAAKGTAEAAAKDKEGLSGQMTELMAAVTGLKTDFESKITTLSTEVKAANENVTKLEGVIGITGGNAGKGQTNLGLRFKDDDSLVDEEEARLLRLSGFSA